MKYPKKAGQILGHISTLKLTPTEFRVILNWLQDSKSFDPSGSTIAKRTNLNADQVRKALRSLRKKNVLVDNGTKSILGGLFIKKYDLHPTILASSQSLSPTTNLSSSTTKGRKNTNDKFDKIIFRYKQENPRWVSKKLIKELNTLLEKEGISKKQKIDKFEELKLEAIKTIAQSQKSDAEKNSWQYDIETCLDTLIDGGGGQTEHLSPEDIAAQKTGFPSAKMRRDYLDSMPVLTPEKLREIEKKRAELINSDEASE